MPVNRRRTAADPGKEESFSEVFHAALRDSFASDRPPSRKGQALVRFVDLDYPSPLTRRLRPFAGAGVLAVAFLAAWGLWGLAGWGMNVLVVGAGPSPLSLAGLAGLVPAVVFSWAFYLLLMGATDWRGNGRVSRGQ